MLSVNFDKPHFPLRAPGRYVKKYAGKVSLPNYPEDYITSSAVPFVKKAIEVNGAWAHYGKDREVHERALAAYYACVEWVDNAIGRILQVLEYLDLADDTIIIYASDHGEMAGEKGAWQKTVFFDASAKVPLIMRWADNFSNGNLCKEPVGLIDLFPTLCDFAQIPVPQVCDGISLKPLLLGDGTIERKAIFSESVVLKVPEYAGCMMRTDKWKYCYYLDGTAELYDMEKDPKEWNNLAKVYYYADIVKEMNAQLLKFWKPSEQIARYNDAPRVAAEKHFYPFSNQFVVDSTIVDARP